MDEHVLRMKYDPSKKEVLFKRFEGGVERPINQGSRLMAYMNNNGQFVLRNCGRALVESIDKLFHGERVVLEVVTSKDAYAYLYKLIMDFNKNVMSQIDPRLISELVGENKQNFSSEIKKHIENVIGGSTASEAAVGSADSMRKALYEPIKGKENNRPKYGRSYVIGSFNIRDFNLTKDFDKLAEIIISEKMDVVGIQEANSRQAVDELVNHLNMRSRNIMTEWKGEFPRYPRSRDASGESYAFVWNNKRLSLVNTKNKENPALIERFRIKGVPGQKELLRNPYFARFTAAGHMGGSNFEIRLINTHIRFGKGPRDAACPSTEKQMRINELNLLMKEILPYCGDIRTGDNMPAYTFLLGDYNLCLDNGGRDSYTISEISEGINKIWKRYYRTVQNLPTSLKKPAGDNVTTDEEDIAVSQMSEYEDYYSQNYDHFTYDTRLDERMQIYPDRIESVDKMYPDVQDRQERLKKHRQEISDHVPVIITINLVRG